MYFDPVNANEEVDSLNTSRSLTIREAEHNLSLEKKKNLILNSELDLSKLVASQEIDKLKRECVHLKDYVSRLEEDRDLFRSREAKDLERAKEFLEYNEKNKRFSPGIDDLKRGCMYLKEKVSRLEEDRVMCELREAKVEEKVKTISEKMMKNEKEFAEQLVELKMKNWDLELALNACAEKCKGLVEENCRLNENGNAGRNENESIGVEICDKDFILFDQIKDWGHENLAKKEAFVILSDAQIPQTPANNNMETDDCDWNNIITTPPESADIQSQSSPQPSDVDHSSSFTTDIIFPSRTSLVDWVKQKAISLGFIVIIMKSEKTTPKRKARLLFACDRGGICRSNARRAVEDVEMPAKKRARSKSTKKCNCPFFLRGVLLEGEMWKLKVENGHHNHELPRSLDGHSHAGRLGEEEKSIVTGMYQAGAKPREILSALKSRNVNNYSTIKTIYNAKKFGEASMHVDSGLEDSVTDN